MNIPQGYKQTELGIIPENWEIKLFSQIFDMFPNNTFPRDCMNDSQGKVHNIHYGDILVKYQTIVDVAKCFIPYINEDIKIKSQKILQSGDIIIADTAEDDTVGKCIEVKNISNEKIVAGLHTFFCHPIISFASGWLGYYMNSSNYHNQLLPYITGIKVSSISRTSIVETKLLVPPLSEQKAIAEALSTVDNLIETLDKKIAKKRLIKQGAMQQLLTGKKRLPGFTEEWVEKKFEQIFIHISAKKSQVDTSKYQIIGKYPILDQSQNNIVGYTDNVNPIVCKPDGAIIFGDHTRIFKYTNHAFYVGADGTQVLFCKDDICTKFMYHLCCILEIPNTGYNRHYKYLKEFIYIIPESKKEQETITTILSDMDKEIEELETRKEKCKLIKAGMMQKLLTGQIRLKTK